VITQHRMVDRIVEPLSAIGHLRRFPQPAHRSASRTEHPLDVRINTDTLTWSVARTSTCDVAGCWRQPVIMAGGRCHQAFCDVHLGPAADLALQFPTFSGWYRVDAVTASNNGQITVTVHPLAS
jgi:hypothetical protein